MDRDKKIKILVVSSKYPPEYAGSGLRAHRTYKRLADKYPIDREVLCSSIVSNGIKEYDHEGVKVHRISNKVFRDVVDKEKIKAGSLFAKAGRKLLHGINYLFEAVPAWAFLLKDGAGFDLFHVFGYNYVTAAALTYAKIAKKPVIIEMCNVSNRYGQYEPWAVRRFFGSGFPMRSKVVCISEKLRKMCAESGYKNEIWCRPNPVDSKKFYSERRKKSEYRNKLGLFESEDIVLLNIGRMRPLKNQTFLIDVLKGLPEHYKLVIAGPLTRSGPHAEEDGAYFNSMREKISRYGLGGRVRIEERFISNVEEFMKASDIYLLPSVIEACATPVMEALACGTPVVAHKIEGVTTEWVKEGVNGYLSRLEEGPFKERVLEAASLNAADMEEASREVRDISDSMDGKYMEMVEDLLSR
jgi:glycosyltransferase involved in cell wall biosynthesis